MSDSKVTLHMVSSLDGFIAKKNGDVSWLQSGDNYEQGVTLTEEDIANYIESIDCYVMGAKTYEQALKLGWPYGEVPVIVLTHRNFATDRKNVEFYSGDINQLLTEQLKPHYKNIWLVGGAQLAKDFLYAKLVDKIIVSIMPIILGDGLLFFDFVGQQQLLHLTDVTSYKDGMVELTYEIKVNS